jgi:hypothetical protein
MFGDMITDFKILPLIPIYPRKIHSAVHMYVGSAQPVLSSAFAYPVLNFNERRGGGLGLGGWGGAWV